MFGRAPKRSNNLKYYETLGVPKGSTQDELKRAYKKAAIKNHPDKGGDPEKFKEVAQAYEVLSDPKRREIYDVYGQDGLKEGMGRAGDAHDPFNMFRSFSGGGFSGGFSGGFNGGFSGGFNGGFSGGFNGGFSDDRGTRSRNRRGEDLVHPLRVSLEDMYNGTYRKLSIARNILCPTCKGKGSTSVSSSRCYCCQGTGVRTTSLQRGPGMIQHMQGVCSECRGSGELVTVREKCSQCKGKKVTQEKKSLEVHVEKGMHHGQKIVFSGEADEAPDTITGDVIFVLQQKSNPKFERKSDDLYVEHNLNLREALCGFQFILTHLDRRRLLIKSNPGKVVKPDSYMAIYDEGMPQYQRPLVKGQLIIHFNVDFPNSRFLSHEKLRILETFLPLTSNNHLPAKLVDKCEETILVDVNIEEEMRQKERQRCREGYDEDDDNKYQVACNQQ